MSSDRNESAIRIQKVIRGFLERKRLISSKYLYRLIDYRRFFKDYYKNPNVLDFYKILENDRALIIESRPVMENHKKIDESLIKPPEIIDQLFDKRNQNSDYSTNPLKEWEKLVVHAELKPVCDIEHYKKEEDHQNLSFKDGQATEFIETISSTPIAKLIGIIQAISKENQVKPFEKIKDFSKRNEKYTKKPSKPENKSVLYIRKIKCREVSKSANAKNSCFQLHRAVSGISPYCVEAKNKYWTKYISVLNPITKLHSVKERNTARTYREFATGPDFLVKSQKLFDKSKLSAGKSEKCLTAFEEMLLKRLRPCTKWIDAQLSDFFEKKVEKERESLRKTKTHLIKKSKNSCLYR